MSADSPQKLVTFARRRWVDITDDSDDDFYSISFTAAPKLVNDATRRWVDITDDAHSDLCSVDSTAAPSIRDDMSCESILDDVRHSWSMQSVCSASVADASSREGSRASSKQSCKVSCQVSSQVWAQSKKKEGSRQIQAALEEAGSADEKRQIVAGLATHVYTAAMDKFGNYVLQKAIQVMEAPDLQFMVDEMVAKGDLKLQMLAKHQYGHRVLEQLLRRCASEQVQPISELLLPHVVELAQHKQGNYVLQGLFAVLEFKFEQVTETMPLVQHIDSIAQGFHGSSVLESVLQTSSTRNQKLAEHIACIISNRPRLQSAIMMKVKNGHKLIKLALKPQCVPHDLRSSAVLKSVLQTPSLQSKGCEQIINCPRLKSTIMTKLKSGDKCIDAVLKQQCPQASPQGLHSSAGILMHSCNIKARPVVPC